MTARTYILALIILVGLTIKYATTELLEWPKQCEGKYYCTEGPKPSSYPNESWINTVLTRDYTPTSVARDGTEDRSTTAITDVAKCNTVQSFVSIFAIKDENDIVWYVPETSNFSVKVETYECTNPGRLTGDSQCGIPGSKLIQKEVYCMEQRVAFQFPVLSQDLLKIETELKSPKGGLPLSCSAKILKRN